MFTRMLVLTIVFLGTPGLIILANDSVVTVSSLAELVQAAGQNGQIVTMKPGMYHLADYIPLSAIPERRQRGDFQFLTFGGSNNVFHLKDVTIEVDTALRSALRAPIHTDEFLVKGDNNTLDGLTITNTGDGKSMGGAVLGITGRGNTLRHCTLHVRGSFPYGYGDLFGKGGPDIIGPVKKSGVHITGSGTTLVGCNLYMRSFGHRFYVQEDAENVRFEDCCVEGVMRSTDEILAETSGPAFQAGFRTVVRNRLGEHRVMPGYMKALSEDGFRMYGQHKNLSLKNCTAKNMRGGFELRTKTGARVEDCTALGCERGFWVSTDAVVRNCRGDAQFGPLLFVEGDNAAVDLELLPAESPITVHALASIQGTGSQVTIRPSSDENRTRSIPILIGYGVPGMGDGMAPIPERDARKALLHNETTMPVIIGAKARECEIATRGTIQENKGRDIKVTSVGGSEQPNPSAAALCRAIGNRSHGALLQAL